MTSTQTIITIVLILAILAFRVYRQTREQRWPIGQLWISPLIFLAITVLIVAMDTLQNWIAIVAAIVGLGVGVGIGLYQGNHTTLRIDKPNKAVFIKVTPLGSMIFIGILLLRFGVRFSQMSGVTQQQLASGAVPAGSPAEVLLGSGLLALAAGSILGLRLFVLRRYEAAPDTAA